MLFQVITVGVMILALYVAFAMQTNIVAHYRRYLVSGTSWVLIAIILDRVAGATAEKPTQKTPARKVPFNQPPAAIMESCRRFTFLPSIDT